MPDLRNKVRIAFITNFCSHYRVKTFETLARYFDVDFYFFSAGDEWYWQQQHGVRVGRFKYQYLSGFRIGRTRITPTLPWKLWKGNYDVYIKCINGRFALPLTYLIARLKRKPFILWTGIWMRLQTPFHRLAWPLTRYIYHHADAIVVYGEHVKCYLISEGVPADRIFVAAHAVDNNFYNRVVTEEEKIFLRQQLNIPTNHKVVLYLGRLEELKGLPYLVEAIEMLHRNDTVLVLAGTGSEKKNLEYLVQRKGISNSVRFAGYVPIDKTPLFYAISWVFVLPSISMPYGKETWGLVVNEALNQGLPVITTDSVGAAAGGLVQDGFNGFIVPERDSKALAMALDKVLSSPDLREELSRNARSIIASWDNERMVLGFRQAVEYVLTDRQREL
jgi:glycosyltransferase involved in cell wall biosynthesis